jgi:hypothetical protein
LEELFQREYKLKQNIQFLEHEIETSKKNNVSNLKNQTIFMKSLQNQNKGKNFFPLPFYYSIFLNIIN